MAGAMVGVIALLAGCTSAVSQGGTPSDSAEPVRGGTITIVQSADPLPNITAAGRAGNNAWMASALETLVRTDIETAEPVGLLAESWELSDDSLTLDITLHDDVVFHNGKELTAADIKANIERAADPASGSRFVAAISTWESVEAIDDTTLQIVFATPSSNVFDVLEGIYIVDPDTFDGLPDGSEVIGTGPYVFGGWEPGVGFELTRNEEYRDPEVGYLDSIEFAIITDATANVSALRSDRAQMSTGLSAADVKSFETNNAYQVFKSGGTIWTLGVDVTVPPYDNPVVRQAIGYAIDRDRINEQVMGGTGTTTDLWWGPGTPGYSEELADHYTYDPDKAREMLEAEGAVGADLPIIVASIPIVQSAYEILQNNLQEVGINATAVTVSVTEFDEMQAAGNMGPGFINFHGQVGLSAATLIGTLPAIREGNPSKFWPDEYVSLREDLLQASTDDYPAAVESLSEYMIDEAFTQPFVQAPGLTVASAALQGTAYTQQGYLDLRDAFLSE